MNRDFTLLLLVLAGLGLVGCGDAITLTQAERATCDKKVNELLGRKAVGEDVAYHVRTTNGTKSARVIYSETSNFPGVQCDLVEGKIMNITKFERIFSVSGEKI